METLKLELNQQQLQIISAALAELPYRVSAQLLSHIESETRRQLAEFNARLDSVVLQDVEQ